MYCDIFKIDGFYQSTLGQSVALEIVKVIQNLWPDLDQQNLVFCGYPWPFLQKNFKADKTIVLSQPQLGAIVWPSQSQNRTVLVDEERLPVPDASVNHVIMVNFLEHAHHPTVLMREIWRVLKGEGKLLIFVPNRHSFWSHSEKTPFGFGHPFTHSQLDLILRQHCFTPLQSFNLLNFWPYHGILSPSIGRLIVRLYPSVGGIIVNESVKKMYARVRHEKKRRVLEWATNH